MAPRMTRLRRPAKALLGTLPYASGQANKEVPDDAPTRQNFLSLLPRFINTTTFAARDFWPRRGASDAHTLQGSVRSEQRRLGQKEPPPGGLRRIWLLALLLLGHRALAAMLPRRASPEAKCSATNVVVFMKRGTKAQQPRIRRVKSPGYFLFTSAR